MSKLIEVSSLTKLYRSGSQKVYALENVNLSIDSGEYIAIVGPSGAGKSTLLHILGGLDFPSEGKVLFKGKDVCRIKDKEISFWRNNHIGFVFQFYHLIEELNILENVALALRLGKKKYSLKTAKELLKYLGIQERETFFPSQLSGGERQKVAIARALANDPELLLCDEPTGNLDHNSQEKVIQLLDRLHGEKGKTIILVTHNLELAKKAQRILFIEDGKIK